MARRRKRRTLRPRVPKRVKQRTKRDRKPPRGHQHPELIGLGLLAVGAFLGAALGGGLGLALGGTGVAIVGVSALLAGALLLTGASAGAIVRRSGRAVHTAARRSLHRRPSAPPLRVIEGDGLAPEPQAPPVDVVNAFPDIVSETEPPPLLIPEPEVDEQETLF